MTRADIAARLQARLAALPERWAWTAHNLIAHPLGEILFQVGLEEASNWLHDATIPAGTAPGQGRG